MVLSEGALSIERDGGEKWGIGMGIVGMEDKIRGLDTGGLFCYIMG